MREFSLTWKKKCFYWLISSYMDWISVTVGSVSATCRSGLVPNCFWHVERTAWFNIVADLFVTLKWYCFFCMNIHEYISTKLVRYEARNLSSHEKDSKKSFYWLISSYWDKISVRSCNGLLFMNTRLCSNWSCNINNYVMWDSLENSNY